MSAQELDAALSAPDDNASYSRLSALISRDVHFTGDSLPATALRYLHVFCDNAVAPAKRRYVGIVLSKLLDTSTGVVDSLKTHAKELSQLGQIILQENELEESKIVAGFVIRQALRHGIDFASCWPSEKVPNTMAYFPEEDGHKWIQSFQEFLDTLAELKLMASGSDSAVLYPVSMLASDGFKWPDAGLAPPVALVQDSRLTIITTDPAMQGLGFVDIPLNHVHHTRLKKSTLYDSQERETDLEPWDVVISLSADTRTYSVNASDHMADEISIMFPKQRDAKECEACIAESRTLRSPRPESSSKLLTPGASNADDGIRHSSVGGRSVSKTAGRGMESPEEPNHPTRKGVTVNPPDITMRDSTSQPNDNTASPHTSRTGANANGKAVVDPGKRKSIRSHPEPTRGALAPVKKAKRISDTAEKAAIETQDEDPWVIPNTSSGTKSPPKKSKGKSGQKVTSKAVKPYPTPTPGKFTTTKSKPTPKPRAKIGRKQIINDTEDEDVSLVFQRIEAQAQPTLSANNNAGPSKLDAGTTQEQGSTAKAPPRSGLLNTSMPGNKKTAPKRKRRGEDESGEDGDGHDIPLDEGQKPVKRRRPVKKVDYNEAESSEETESVGSDYAPSQPMRREAAKRTIPEKARTQNKGEGVSHAKTRMVKGSKRTAPESVSPAKHGVLSKLLSKDQLGASNADHHPLKQNPKKDSKETTKKNVLPVKVHEISSATKNTDLSSEANILGALIDDMINGKEVEQSPLRNDARIGHAPLPLSVPVHQDVAPNEDEYGALPIESDLPELPIATRRKRSVVSPLPSTPQAKRPRKDLARADEVAKSIFADAPTTMAPSRSLLDDAGSPCVDDNLQRSSRGRATNGTARRTPAPSIFSQSAVSALPQPRDNHHTPFHQAVKRTSSGSSMAAEMLSSNSKPLPTTPYAASRAISFHANTEEVDLEKEIGDHETENSNPFRRASSASKETNFIRRLTGFRPSAVHGNTPEKHPKSSPQQPGISVEAPSPAKAPRLDRSLRRGSSKGLVKPPAATVALKQCSMGKQNLLNAPHRAEEQQPSLEENNPPDHLHMPMDDDETLVDLEDKTVPMKTSPTHFQSSPPGQPSSPSSHSSTSAEPEPPSEHWTEISSSTRIEAEEREWEESLKPHQRALATQMIRVSKRVLRHIVDNETAVDDIVETYAMDGETLVNDFNKRQGGQLEPVLEDIKKKKATMKKELEELAAKLSRDRKRLKA